MITPTRTVCYAEVERSKKWHKVLSDEGDGLRVKVDHKLNLSAVWPYGYFSRIIVREEPIKKEKGPNYPWCNKTFNPMNACDCGDCAAVLNFFSKLKGLPL